MSCARRNSPSRKRSVALRGKNARNKTKIAKKPRLSVRLNATNVDENGSRNERREKRKEIANERSVIVNETYVKSAGVNVTRTIGRRIAIATVIETGLGTANLHPSARTKKKSQRNIKRSYRRRRTIDWKERHWLTSSAKATVGVVVNMSLRLILHLHLHREGQRRHLQSIQFAGTHPDTRIRAKLAIVD